MFGNILMSGKGAFDHGNGPGKHQAIVIHDALDKITGIFMHIWPLVEVSSGQHTNGRDLGPSVCSLTYMLNNYLQYCASSISITLPADSVIGVPGPKMPLQPAS